MGCRLTIRRFGLGAAAFLAAVQFGCADPEGGRRPDEVLSIASAGLEGVDRYTFRARTAVRHGGIELQELESYEGEIAGHAVQTIRSLSDDSARTAGLSAETPASRLAELARRKAEVEFADRAPEGCVALRIRLTGEAAAQDIKSRLMRQFEHAAEKAASGLGGGTAEAYRRAVEAETARFRQELARMLDGLQAETSAIVTIDRKTMLPVELEETAVLRYEAGGRTRTEERVTRMMLDGFDGRPPAS